MKPGTNHIIWALGAFLVTGTAIVLAVRFHGSDPVFRYGASATFWMFLGAGGIVGLTGLYLLLIGIRERSQYVRTRASIATAPDHKPGSRDELIVRIVATLAATESEPGDESARVVRDVLAQIDAATFETAPLPELLREHVSRDIASEVLAAEALLDAGDREFILQSCFLLLEAMDDPGPVQEELMVRIAAAMGMSELALATRMDGFERSAVALSRFDTTDR